MDIETKSVLRRHARPAVGPGRSAPGLAWGFILTLFLLLGGSPAPAAIAAAEPRDFQTIREYLDTARALKETDRVRVRGTVTHVSADGTFFIQDQTAGVYVFYRTNTPFKSAEIVEVTASPSLGGFSPSLQRCTVARVGAGVLPRPVPVTISTVLSGKYDMQWVQIEGRLSFDRLRRGGQMVLILEADADNFTVEIDPRGQEEALARLRPGSQLRVTGVCSVRPDATKTPTSFHVLVNSLNDLVELAPPPWWTPVRTLRVLGLAGFGLALALAWAGLLRRQVRKQTGIIRERLQKEAAIEGQFRELVEHAVDVIYTHDLQGRFTSWNHAGETILGYPRAEIIGMNIAQLIVPGQEEVSGRMVTPATAEHAAPTYKLELRTQDGRRRTFEINSWLVTRAGQAVEVQGIGRDITERERVEAALRESEDRYRILVELSPEAIVVHRGGIILFVNKAYLELIGATGPAQLLGRTVLEFVHPESQANVLNRIERTQATEEPLPAAELQCTRLDGRIMDVEAVSVGITYQGDRATLAVLRDITERKRAEQIRETVRDLAQQLTGSLCLKSLGRIVAAACRRLFQYDAFLLYTVDPHSDERMVVHAEDTPSGGSAPVEVEPVFTEGQSRIENRVFNGEQELINRFEEPKRAGVETWGYTNRLSRSLLFIPVRWEGRCVGVITVQSYTPGQYRERDLETLQVIADQCGGAAMRVLGETALRASEEQLRRALAAARMGTWDWDITRNTVQWSARVEDIFGRHPGEFRGTYDAFIALIHPDDRQFVVGAILDCAEGARDDYQIEHRIVLPDGTTRWIEGKGRIDRDEASRAIRMAGTVLDITERKGTEQKLRESERSLFEFLEASPIGVFVVNRQGQPFFANQNAKELLGQGIAPEAGPHKLAGHYQAYVTGTNRLYPTEQLPLIRALAGERVSVEDMEIRRADRTIPLQVWAAPIYDSTGQVAFAIAAFGDISERQRVQQELHASQEKFSRAFRSSPDAIMITHLADGRIIDVNEGFEKLFGYTPQEALGRSTLDLRIWADPAQRAAAIQQLRKQGAIRNLEVQLRIKSGDLRTCLASVELVEIGGVPCMISVTRDITERKEAEQQIRLLNQELEKRVELRTAELVAVNKELEAFSYSVSHDLRAPLRHITGFAALLLDNPALRQTPEIRRHMATIDAAAKRMGRLIDDLLEFSRMGRAKLHTSHVPMAQLVATARQELDPETHGRAIEWHIHPLPAARVDAAMFRLVWQNLLSNAIKYTRHRDPARIEIGSRESDRETIFYVQDNGAGFDMKYANKLFGVFQRLHREDEFEGTGIGLANVRRIIHHHRGRVWAESELERGARFYFTLPHELRPADREEKTPMPASEPQTSP